MRYKQIIFDVDDTIIDFAATEDFALHSLFNAHHWPLSQELQQQALGRINEKRQVEEAALN